jgi:hypothetical protein
MKVFHIKRPNDEIEVVLVKYREEDKFSFVNLTKGHICPCIFKSENEAIEDLNKYKRLGKIIDYYEIN